MDGFSLPPTAAGPNRLYGMRRGSAHAPQPPWRRRYLLRDEAGNRPCPPAAKADTLRRMNSQGLITGSRFFDLGWTLALCCCAMYSEVCWPKLQETGGTRPGRCGGRAVFGRSFVSFPFGRPWGPVGVEAPGSRPVHGSWTAPARIRDGTQGIANLKGSSSTAALGGSFGAGPRQVSFSCVAARLNLSKDGALLGCPPRAGK